MYTLNLNLEGQEYICINKIKYSEKKKGKTELLHQIMKSSAKVIRTSERNINKNGVCKLLLQW